jgi:hypothetical protein
MRLTELLVALVLVMQSVSGRTCPDSRTAEDAIAKLHTWADLHATFKSLAACDDGGIAEGWSEFVTRTLARKWNTVAELQKLVSTDRSFRLFVVRHVDATADEQDLRQVLTNARNRCARSDRSLCAELEGAANRSLASLTPGQR